MTRPPSVSSRLDALFPYPTLFRSFHVAVARVQAHAQGRFLVAEDVRVALAVEVHGNDLAEVVRLFARAPLAAFHVHQPGIADPVDLDRHLVSGDRKSTRLNSSH